MGTAKGRKAIDGRRRMTLANQPISESANQPINQSANQPISQSTVAERPGLYVHVPFCLSKCIYCDFYSITESDLVERWLDALEGEMSLYAGAFHPFDSLYVGGGTPSLLSAGELNRLVLGLNRHFSFSPKTEFTIEANPDDIDTEKLALMRDLGVNRISFGIQSFNDRDLSFLKRRHDAAGAGRAIEKTRRAGFTNISLDLIYGLPRQTKAGWLATLERAVSFEPTHLSCYQLTLEGRTPLRGMVESHTVKLPTEETGRRLFLATSEFLTSRGFVHYEISSFAASARYTCRHNQKYWRHVPYLGLGPAAHSFDGSHRWWNVRSVAEYCDAVERGDRPIEGKEDLTTEQISLERLYLGLRTSDGISTDCLPGSACAAVDQLRKARLVRVDKGRIKPTARGFLVADSLPILLSES